MSALKPFTVIARFENYDDAGCYCIMAASAELKDVKKALHPIVLKDAIEDNIIEEDSSRDLYILHYFEGHHADLGGCFNTDTISCDYGDAKAICPELGAHLPDFWDLEEEQWIAWMAHARAVANDRGEILEASEDVQTLAKELYIRADANLPESK